MCLVSALTTEGREGVNADTSVVDWLACTLGHADKF